MRIGYTLYKGIKSEDEWFNLIKTMEIEDVETESYKNKPEGVEFKGISKIVITKEGLIAEEEFDDDLWEEIE
jgi:hypothetical protein